MGLSDALAGRRSVIREGGGMTMARFTTKGEYIIGEYQGSKKLPRGGTGHMVKVEQSGCTFTRGKGVIVEVKAGEIVFLTGRVLDPAFEAIKPGITVGIEFDGTKENTKGNPTKLFKVLEVIPA